MNRKDRIKLDFTRNWKLPGKERLTKWLQPSPAATAALKNGITWLTNEDIAIFTTADNYIEWMLLSTGTYEDEINKLIRISLKQGNTALDIGGNIGLQSIRMAQCVGDGGHVYAFEPLNYLQQKFSKNVALNRLNNITLLPYALSDKEETLNYQVNENSWNQGTFSLNNREQGATAQQVTIKMADNLPEVQNLPRLDLIKIDVEGYEYHVLLGLGNTLQKHRPRIIFEFDGNYWNKTGQQIANCYHYLTNLGYTLYQITSAGCILITNASAIVSGNLFCLPVNE